MLCPGRFILVESVLREIDTISSLGVEKEFPKVNACYLKEVIYLMDVIDQDALFAFPEF